MAIYVDALGQALEEGLLRNVVVSPLTLFFLEDKRDATDRATGNSLHQVGHKAGNLVSKSLGGDDGNFTTDLLVDVEVEGQLGVISLNDKASGFLDGFCSYATLLRIRQESSRNSTSQDERRNGLTMADAYRRWTRDTTGTARMLQKHADFSARKNRTGSSDKMSVILETSLGTLTLDLFTDDCPIACKNFLKLCKAK